MLEIRCPSRIHLKINDQGLIEVKCSSKRCGAGSGVSVFHYYTITGTLVRTRKYNDPAVALQGEQAQEA